MPSIRAPRPHCGQDAENPRSFWPCRCVDTGKGSAGSGTDPHLAPASPMILLGAGPAADTAAGAGRRWGFARPGALTAW
jgi:hypothetical protein